MADDEPPRVKFLCSFNGSIMPRPQDGKLRYVGGETRFVSLPRDINYDELMVRMKELFDSASVLKYQQPDEDLDALVSVVNDDGVTNMMEVADTSASRSGFTILQMFLFPDVLGGYASVLSSMTSAASERRYVDALNSLNDFDLNNNNNNNNNSYNGMEAPWVEYVVDKGFNYLQIQRATKDFDKSLLLGSGGCGQVYKGFLEEDKTWIAVKMVERQSYDEKEFRSEISALSNVTHPNLVRLRGHGAHMSETGKKLFIVYDLFKNGSLDSWIFPGSPDGRFLNWNQRLEIATDVAEALSYLHHDCRPNQIIHLDVKPQNILISDDMRGILADFGMAKLIDKEESTFQTLLARGTSGYMAPEWSYGYRMSKSVDIYSYGKVLLDLFVGKQLACFDKDGESLHVSLGKVPIFQRRSLNFLKDKIQKKKVLDLIDERLMAEGNVNERVASCFVSIAIQCMDEDPEERPDSMSKVLTMLVNCKAPIEPW